MAYCKGEGKVKSQNFLKIRTFNFAINANRALVECNREGNIKYHPTRSACVTEQNTGKFGMKLSDGFMLCGVFKHNKTDETKPLIAEVNVTSPKAVV